MELKRAIEIMERHQNWRRDLPHDLGKGTKMVEPKLLGEAIDKLLEVAKEKVK